MEKYLSSLKDSELFNGISEENILRLLKCLSGHKKKIKNGEFFFHAGDKVKYVYIILSGSIHIVDEDFWGNRSIIEMMPQNTFFGEAYVFSKSETQLVSLIAAEDSVILEINPKKLFDACADECKCHSILSRNAIRILSTKIVRLTEKLMHIMQRTTQEKVISYLSYCARNAQNDSFDIPYSRQELADFLCVERTALSHELSRLKKIGMIDYHKNHFTLLTDYMK